MKCKHCNGTGTTNWCVNGTFVNCPYCGGTGEMEMETTNEEWLRSATTEQLAEWLVDVTQHCFECSLNINNCVLCPFKKCIDKDYAVEWLKQPHTNKE